MTNARAAAAGYGRVAKGLHWLVVALLALQCAIAWSMPHIRRATEPVGLIDLHLKVGVLILIVVLVRLLWRWRFPVPLPTERMPAWQTVAARATHVLLYAILVALPLLGWANASARGWHVSLFGAVPLPPLVSAESPRGLASGDIHTAVAWVLLAAVGLHLCAALYHHFVRRDEVLRRMLP
jgi:cytochrome b561